MESLIAFAYTISLTFFYIATAQSNVTRGSSLTPNGATTSWLSPSGLYAFGFYPQSHGHAVGIYIAGVPERPVVWTASRENLPLSDNAILRFTDDGRLAVDQTDGQQINIFNTGGASFASMQDSGNFVLYDSEGTTVLWQSFDYPTETLLVGQRLVPRQTLFSSVSEADQSVGFFRLRMHENGNLALYPNVGTTLDDPFWTSDTYRSNMTLYLGSGGYLYLQNSTFFVKNLTQGGNPTKDAIYRMKIDLDGIFRLYYHNLTSTNKNGSVIWTPLANKCAGRGLCGVNGYCFVMNDAARCRCMPGYKFIDPERWILGCHKNYTVDSCKMPNATFVMTNLNNAKWEEATYAIPKASTLEECSSACLNDCNCEAALFINRECRFQRLPLRYIEVIEGESDVGLFKVFTSYDPTNQSTNAKKVPQKGIIIAGILLISFAVLILLILRVIMRKARVFLGVIMRKARVLAYRKISKNQNDQLFKDVGPRAFSYDELERITDGFKEELGRGSFGIVYKGIIESSKTTVAVKKLKQELAQEAGEREFQTEMKVIGRTHHRNLARLLGYCSQGLERLLVLEYMSRGSLADIIFQPKESELKPCWKERMTIAVDIARGILYLHEECETAIIHCDIKPQNILMDEYGCAKISDFGLAKLLEHDQTRTSTLMRGTRGYVAPEWHKNLPVTVKVDVYSFGILLFNIICCRRNVDNTLPDREAILAEWVSVCYEADELQKLVDHDEDVDMSTLDKMVKIGLWCTQEDPTHRPSMKNVLSMLEGTVKVPAPPKPSSFLSIS